MAAIEACDHNLAADMAIYDTMQYVRPDVVTTCVGQAASVAGLLLTAGAPKKRLSLPNSRILNRLQTGRLYCILPDFSLAAWSGTIEPNLSQIRLLKRTVWP